MIDHMTSHIGKELSTSLRAQSKLTYPPCSSQIAFLSLYLF